MPKIKNLKSPFCPQAVIPTFLYLRKLELIFQVAQARMIRVITDPFYVILHNFLLTNPVCPTLNEIRIESLLTTSTVNILVLHTITHHCSNFLTPSIFNISARVIFL